MKAAFIQTVILTHAYIHAYNTYIEFFVARLIKKVPHGQSNVYV